MRSLQPLLMIGLVFLFSCKKKESSSVINGLPPITDTGAGTFGCMVDGNLFKPQKNAWSSSIILKCYYQNVYGTQFFQLSAIDAINGTAIGFNIDSISIYKDTVFKYSFPAMGNAYARYDCCNNTSINPRYSTYLNIPGEFRISKFDLRHQIVAGTFWFDAVDTATHDTVRVRDGRFDVHFSL